MKKIRRTIRVYEVTAIVADIKNKEFVNMTAVLPSTRNAKKAFQKTLQDGFICSEILESQVISTVREMDLETFIKYSQEVK